MKRFDLLDRAWHLRGQALGARLGQQERVLDTHADVLVLLGRPGRTFSLNARFSGVSASWSSAASRM